MGILPPNVERFWNDNGVIEHSMLIAYEEIREIEELERDEIFLKCNSL